MLKSCVQLLFSSLHMKEFAAEKIQLLLATVRRAVEENGLGVVIFKYVIVADT